MGQEWLLRKELKDARRAKNHADHVEKMRQKTNGRRATRSLERYAKEVEKYTTMDIPDPRLLPDADLAELITALMQVDKYDWLATARPDQLEPENYAIWLLCGGRGSGKTRTSAETVRKACEVPGTRAAVIAKDHRALRDVCFEGVSGLLACLPPDSYNPKDYNKGLGDVGLKLKNGSTIKGYTAGEPDAIRGQSFDILWGDEFSSWPRNKAEDMLTQARMCLREAEHAKAVLSTTPKRAPHFVGMVNLAKDPAERIVVTHSRSRDNTALSADWHEQMERQFGGTRMGRQELDGELVMDLDNALFTWEMLDNSRWDKDEELPPMARVVIGVDPSGSKDGDATGISVIGYSKDKVLFLLENATCNGTPAERYNAACRAAVRHGASEMIVELSYGGDNCIFGLETQWKHLVSTGEISEDRRMPFMKGSKIRGDKAARMMPCVALFEQQISQPDRRRIWIAEPDLANGLTAWMDEALSWETNSTKSPNALDAFAHATRYLMRELGWEVSISAPTSPHSTRQATVHRVRGGYQPY